MRAGYGDGVFEREAVGHERGGVSAGSMRFGDGAVNAGREAEVVGVEDEAGAGRHARVSVREFSVRDPRAPAAMPLRGDVWVERVSQRGEGRLPPIGRASADGPVAQIAVFPGG